jgi:lipopolysaccharide export system protein LptA
MNKARKALVIAGVLALAASAYAADITLNNPAMVNGKQLAAGQYDLKVNASGDVTFLRGKTEVATAKARLENRDTKARYNTIVTRASDNGLPSITEIQFEGKKQALVFDNTAQASNER